MRELNETEYEEVNGGWVPVAIGIVRLGMMAHKAYKASRVVRAGTNLAVGEAGWAAGEAAVGAVTGGGGD